MTVELIRKGDFYNAYGEEAFALASAASLVITKRRGNAECGFRWQNIDKIVDALQASGHGAKIIG